MHDRLSSDTSDYMYLNIKHSHITAQYTFHLRHTQPNQIIQLCDASVIMPPSYKKYSQNNTYQSQLCIYIALTQSVCMCVYTYVALTLGPSTGEHCKQMEMEGEVETPIRTS